MKIYLIDDNRSGTLTPALREELKRFEEQGLINIIEHLSADREEDTALLETLDPGESCVFYHASFIDSDADGNFIGSTMIRDFIMETVVENKITSVRFSDGVVGDSYFAAASGHPERVEMRKTVFYSRLPDFLRLWENEGRMNLRGLAEGFGLQDVTTPEVAEDITPTEPEIIEVSGSDGKIRIGDNIIYEREVMALSESILSAFLAFPDSERGAVRIDLSTLSALEARFIALMLRLGIGRLRRRSLRPLIFSDAGHPMEVIMEFSRTSDADILLAPGSRLESLGESGATGPLDARTFVEDFLPKIKVKPIAEVGNHTIANDWGAYVVGKYLKDFRSTLATQDPLYLAYLLAQRLSTGDVRAILDGRSGKSNKISRINAGKKRILLVDDQDDKWKNVICHLFSDPGKITVIGKSLATIPEAKITEEAESCFLTPGAWKEILSGNYDLILLDLRLGGVREETLDEYWTGDGRAVKSVQEMPEFSGMRVLRKISESSPGQQVIMFTSSNKAWNMRKAMLEYGAAGYYIKESPSQKISEEESRESIIQLKQTIEDALDRSYLKDMMRDAAVVEEILNEGIDDEFEPLSSKAGDALVNLVDNASQTHGVDSINESLREIADQIAIAMKMHEIASRTHDDNDYAYAYIALEQVLEVLAHLSPLPQYDEDNGRLISVAERVAELIDDCGNLRAFTKVRNGLIHKQDDKVTEGIENGIDPYSPEGFRSLWDEIYWYFA